MGITSFDYRILFGVSTLQPILQIHLLGPTKSVPVDVRLDSGADMPILPQHAAEDAKLILPAHPNVWIQYGGSKVPARRIQATMLIGTHRFRPDVAFVEKLEFPYGLLGRIGVFSQFNEVVFLEKLANPRIELRW
jgi:hypothetical protein